MYRNLIYSGGEYRLSRRTLRLHLRQGWQGPLPRHTTHEACLPFVRTSHVRAVFRLLRIVCLPHSADLYRHKIARSQSALCTTLHYTTLHYTTLHYITLFCTTLHYTTLHFRLTPQHACSCACAGLSIHLTALLTYRSRLLRIGRLLLERWAAPPCVIHS